MIIDNPNTQRRFEREEGEYGFRTIDGLEEVVHIPTGKSNMQYHKPERILHTDNCKHVFQIVDMGKREFACKKCNWTVSVIVNQILEDDHGMRIQLKQGVYPVDY